MSDDREAEDAINEIMEQVRAIVSACDADVAAPALGGLLAEVAINATHGDLATAEAIVSDVISYATESMAEAARALAHYKTHRLN
jgi:hypothetical protein